MAATLSLFCNGLSVGVPGMPNHNSKRGGISGWSPGAVRRNLHFLYSIDAEELQRDGTVAYAFTLTVRDCPETPRAWSAVCEQFLLSMQRNWDCVRIHWVVEWQKRKVPHLHGCLFFQEGFEPELRPVVNAWCFLARHHDAHPHAQSVKRIYGLKGWMQYVAKHAARGLHHYQRAGDAIPPAWRGQTGRLWGHRGNWPRHDPQKFTLEGREGDGAFFAFRRLARSWRIADARISGDPRRISSARWMLRCPDPRKSELRGVSEWIAPAVAQKFIANLVDRGYSIGLPPREIPP